MLIFIGLFTKRREGRPIPVTFKNHSVFFLMRIDIEQNFYRQSSGSLFENLYFTINGSTIME